MDLARCLADTLGITVSRAEPEVGASKRRVGAEGIARIVMNYNEADMG